jgi:hypothetical protein
MPIIAGYGITADPIAYNDTTYRGLLTIARLVAESAFYMKIDDISGIRRYRDNQGNCPYSANRPSPKGKFRVDIERRGEPEATYTMLFDDAMDAERAEMALLCIWTTGLDSHVS